MLQDVVLHGLAERRMAATALAIRLSSLITADAQSAWPSWFPIICRACQAIRLPRMTGPLATCHTRRARYSTA